MIMKISLPICISGCWYLSQPQFWRGSWDLSQPWFGRGGCIAWEGGLRSWINNDKRPRNNYKKNIVSKLHRDRGIYTWTSCIWIPSHRFPIGWARWINTWAKIYLMVQFLSTCSWVVAASWWRWGHSKNTAILRGYRIWFGALTFFTSVYFKVCVRIKIRVTRSGTEYSHRCTKRFNCGTRDKCLTSYYKTGASLDPSSNQCLYGDTTGHPWIQHWPY